MRLARVAVTLAVFAACATGGQRPRFGAAPESHLLLLRARPDSVIRVLTERAQGLGLDVLRSAPREGYLETTWYDLHARARAATPFDRLDSIVKFRFFADPVQGKTRVLGEAMRRIAWDPSMPERDLERMVPEGHPALALLDSVMVVVKEDTTKATGGPPLPDRP